MSFYSTTEASSSCEYCKNLACTIRTSNKCLLDAHEGYCLRCRMAIYSHGDAVKEKIGAYGFCQRCYKSLVLIGSKLMEQRTIGKLVSIIKNVGLN